jgi:hypothetical protein
MDDRTGKYLEKKLRTSAQRTVRNIPVSGVEHKLFPSCVFVLPSATEE